MDQPVPAPEAPDPAGERDRPRWSAWSRAAVVTGLLGVALTQPLLDLMGRNPAFFVAGQYTSGQIVQFALIVALVPTAIVVAVVLLAGRLHRGVGDVVYQLVVFGLGGVFGNVLARGMDLEGGKVAVAAGLVGGALALAAVRFRPGRMLLEYLAVGNVFFLVAFLVMSPTSDLIGGSGELELGRVSMPTPPGPVVVIVFDELPVSTLLSADGTINEERYPAFARLGESATWWRNASSTHSRTEVAVSQLLTGTMTEADTLPGYVDLPRNLLTMFSSLPVERYEPITDMCPRSQCEARVAGSLDQALYDASVVFGHRVLPRRLRNELPAIDQAWGGFGEVGGDQAAGPAATGDLEECRRRTRERGEDVGRLCLWKQRDITERDPAAQAAVLEALGPGIGAEPALHFAHVVLPHYPWVLDPWGHRLLGAAAPAPDDKKHPTKPSDPSYEWLARLQYQRHSLQVGAADVALGSVLDDIDAAGAWDDTTLVVMADHGVSVLPPHFGRNIVNDHTVEEIHRIPLFIKAPGQAKGEVVDEPALSIDMLPTLADVLDVELDWDFDGHSLLDGSEATVEPWASKDVQPLFGLVERHIAQVPNGEDWLGLAKVGEHADLVGTPLTDHEAGPPSDLQWAPQGEDDFDSLPTPEGQAPQVLNGSVSAPGGERPPPLVVSVNGTIAGVIDGYYRHESGWRFSSVLGPYLRDGANEIVAYQVDGDVLRPLG